jgi:hypothetical protein
MRAKTFRYSYVGVLNIHSGCFWGREPVRKLMS